jgi:hypothetical protein
MCIASETIPLGESFLQFASEILIFFHSLAGHHFRAVRWVHFDLSVKAAVAMQSGILLF